MRGYREETILAIQQHRGRRIAVLVTGDPGLASLASAVIEHFGFSFCRVLPGISSHRLGNEWRIVVAEDLTLASERIFEVHADQLGQLPQSLRAVILFLRKSGE